MGKYHSEKSAPGRVQPCFGHTVCASLRLHDGVVGIEEYAKLGFVQVSVRCGCRCLGDAARLFGGDGVLLFATCDRVRALELGGVCSSWYRIACQVVLQITTANLRNDKAQLAAVANLIRPIAEAWRDIRPTPAAHNTGAAQAPAYAMAGA